MKPIRRAFHPCLLACVRRPGARAFNPPALNGLRAATGIVLVLATLASDRAAALDRTWIGGNVDWIDGGSAANWSPSGEPGTGDTAIFSLAANTVNLGSINSILALTMSNGISLNTNDFDLTLNGLLQLVDAGTDLTIGGTAGSVFADDITINSGADIILDGGTLTMAKDVGAGLFAINAGGMLTGQGTVSFGDLPLGAPTSLLVNSGTISAAFPGFIFGNPPAGTLAINASDVTNARLDLDAFLPVTSVVNVFRNQTLDINVNLSDAYSGDLNLFHNSTIDVSTPWNIDAGSTVDIDNGFVNNGGILDIPASTSFISGAAFTQSDGTITVIDGDGALQFNAPFTMNGGNLVNNGEVIFNANATVAAAANFTMPTSTSSLTVNAGVEVNIDDANFNADGGGFFTNVITIGSAGILDLDLGVGADVSLNAAIALNGGELDVTSTAVDAWSIMGPLTVGVATVASQINGEPVSFSGPVTIGANSVLDVNAASTLNSSSSFAVGSGASLQLNANTLNSITSITGAGTLQVLAATTVAANSTIAVGTFDWDGTAPGTSHTINSGVTLTINSPNIDTDGTIDDNITLTGNGSTLTVNGPASWEMKGTLTANPADVGIATIGGTSRLVLTTASGILNANGDTTISAPVTFGASSTTNIAAPAILTVTGNAIYHGGTITGAGTYNPPTGANNTVSSNSAISPTNFNFDLGSWVVDPGSTLAVNVTDYDSDSVTNAFDNTITIQSGTASVNSGDAAFIMNGVLNLSTTTGTFAIWSGEPLHIGNDSGVLDADLNISGTGNAQIESPVTFFSDADVNIDAGSKLQFLSASSVSFNSVNGANNAEFTGSGTLTTSGTVDFNEATTLNMPGGTVDLDGVDAIGNIISVDARVVINVASMSSFGKSNVSGTNILDIDSLSAGTTGSLTVNLDSPTAAWTLNAQGVMNLTNDNTVATLLAGSPVNLNGTVNVTGDVRTDARVDIGSTGIINILTGWEPFRLSGGDLTTTNTINGGTINGPGLLGADTISSLTGFGTIAANAGIDFDNESDLLADNGTLTVNSAIVDVAYIGTADADGTLNVPNPWTPPTGSTLKMQGGLLQGGEVTLNNANGMEGHGQVSARIINNTIIQANNPGSTLKLTNTANDWDGTDAPDDGTLHASNGGTLECIDNAGFIFDGTINAFGGGTVFSNGFDFILAPASTLSLASGGTYKSTNTTDIEGTVTVGAGADSTINSLFVFDATSATTLTGNLRLVTNVGNIRAGATFGGAGALKIAPGSFVRADNLADINVLVDNSGDFLVGGLATAGEVTVKDYQQSVTGDMQVDLRGTATNQFDRLKLIAGIARIAGDLELVLGGGYVPALNDTFNVVVANGGVIGTFNPLVQPAGMPAGLVFEVTYLPTLVRLKVVADSTFDTWINSFGSLTNPADKTKSANPDGDGLNNLGEFALDGNPASGASSGKIVGKIAPVGGVNAMTLTIPVRSGAVLDVGDPAGGELVLKQAADLLTYRIQATDDLAALTLDVTEVTGPDATAIQAGLPALNSGWVYRTFRSPGGVAGDPAEFMRVVISE